MADRLFSEKTSEQPMNRVQALAQKSAEDRLKEPTITKINAEERKCVEAMFKLYDIGHTGSIAVHHARKLLKNMGFEAERIPLGSGESDRVTMRDMLLVLESELPQPQPSLPCSLYTFDRIVAKLDEEDGRMKIRPDEIMKFMQSIGRQPTGDTEIGILLSKMLAVDDTSAVPAATVEAFDKEVITFAKRNQVTLHTPWLLNRCLSPLHPSHQSLPWFRSTKTRTSRT